MIFIKHRLIQVLLVFIILSCLLIPTIPISATTGIWTEAGFTSEGLSICDNGTYLYVPGLIGTVPTICEVDPTTMTTTRKWSGDPTWYAYVNSVVCYNGFLYASIASAEQHIVEISITTMATTRSWSSANAAYTPIRNIATDGTYIFGVVSNGAGWVLKLTIADFTTLLAYQIPHGLNMWSILAPAGNYIYVGADDPTAIVSRLNKSDLHESTYWTGTPLVDFYALNLLIDGSYLYVGMQTSDSESNCHTINKLNLADLTYADSYINDAMRDLYSLDIWGSYLYKGEYSSAVNPGKVYKIKTDMTLTTTWTAPTGYYIIGTIHTFSNRLYVECVGYGAVNILKLNPDTMATDYTVKPIITTSTATSIGTTTGTGGANVTSDGGATVTERGICVSTSANPTTSDTKFTTTGTTGVFTVSMTGLTAATDYHLRGYAINGVGTSYSNDTTFTTLGIPAAPANVGVTLVLTLMGIVLAGVAVVVLAIVGFSRLQLSPNISALTYVCAIAIFLVVMFLIVMGVLNVLR
jgi:hypothetical protein